MIEFTEYTPNPLAPIIHVNKVGGLYRVGSLIKVTFVLASVGPGGMTNCVERGSFLWEAADVIAANEHCSWAFQEWTKGTFIIPDDGGGRRARTQ